MNIDEIKQRLAAAHKGPWRAAKVGHDVFKPELSEPGEPYFSSAEDDCILGPNGEEVLGCSEWIRVDWADLEFMAHARQDIEDLLAEIENHQGRTMTAENTLAGMYAAFDPDYPKVKVGKYTICRQDENSVWIQNGDDEGSQFSDDSFFKALDAFYNENF